MKITIDMRSLVMGFFAAGLIFMAISFKNGETDQKGVYQTALGEKGIVILNTETGDYIMRPTIETIGTVKWIKGTFNDTFQNGLDNKKLLK